MVVRPQVSELKPRIGFVVASSTRTTFHRLIDSGLLLGFSYQKPNDTSPDPGIKPEASCSVVTFATARTMR